MLLGLIERRFRFQTAGKGARAAGRKDAALTRNGLFPCLGCLRLVGPGMGRVGQRNRADQQLGIGMARGLDDRADRAQFGHAPAVEDDDVAADLIGRGDVVSCVI